ncbi:MAG: hypothetical protein J1D88_02885 [Treponema sp.]|nr:hypothetical protein [Treponema sp.]
MTVELALFVAGGVLWCVVLVYFCHAIHAAKKKNMRQSARTQPSKDEQNPAVPKPAPSMYGSVALSFALVVLPILVPLSRFVMAIMELCAVLALFITLRERLSQYKQNTEDESEN